MVHQVLRRTHEYGAANGIAEDCRRLVEEHPANRGVGTQEQAVAHKKHYPDISHARRDIDGSLEMTTHCWRRHARSLG